MYAYCLKSFIILQLLLWKNGYNLLKKKTRATWSVTREECSIPKCRASFGKSSFSFVATNQWNTLPTELITCADFKTLSCHAKCWMLCVCVWRSSKRVERWKRGTLFSTVHFVCTLRSTFSTNEMHDSPHAYLMPWTTSGSLSGAGDCVACAESRGKLIANYFDN